MLSDEQMSKGCPFSLLNDEQISNWLGVEHQPVEKVADFMELFLLHVSLVDLKIPYLEATGARGGPVFCMFLSD